MRQHIHGPGGVTILEPGYRRTISTSSRLSKGQGSSTRSPPYGPWVDRPGVIGGAARRCRTAGRIGRSGGRLDVLVDLEEVGRVVRGLQRRQAVVVRPVRCADPVGALLARF